MILKGKEKEFKLNQIKLREVEKYIKNIRSKDGKLVYFIFSVMIGLFEYFIQIRRVSSAKAMSNKWREKIRRMYEKH